MKFYCIKQLNGSFLPANDSDYEKAKKLKVGEAYSFEVKKPRNYEFHKKFFALIKLGFENQEQFRSIDRFREAVTIEAGFIEKKGNIDGSIRIEAKSIGFASMDEFEFKEVYSTVLDVIIKVIGCTNEEIEQNLVDFM